VSIVLSAYLLLRIASDLQVVFHRPNNETDFDVYE
jgi:hypothetical protein